MTRSNLKTVLGSFAVGALLFVIGCAGNNGGGGTDGITATGGGPTGGFTGGFTGGNGNGGNGGNQAQVRFVNGYIPNANGTGTLSVSESGETVFENTTFGSITPTTGYKNVTAGTFSATATGTGVSTPLQISNNSHLGAGLKYTLVAAGQEDEVGEQSPRLFLLPQFNTDTQTIPAGNVAIRVVNLSTSVVGANLYTTSGEQSQLLTTSFGDLGFGYAASTNQYVFVPADTLGTLSFRSTGNLDQDLSLSNTELATYNFQAGNAYTIYLFGNENTTNQNLTVRVTRDAP